MTSSNEQGALQNADCPPVDVGPHLEVEAAQIRTYTGSWANMPKNLQDLLALTIPSEELADVQQAENITVDLSLVPWDELSKVEGGFRHGIQEMESFLEASGHDYWCRCNLCKEWWRAAGPDEEGTYGPFSAEEIVTHV